MTTPERSRPDRWAVGWWLIASLPTVVAAIRAVRADWVPLGDVAVVGVRAHDVLTAHHPLLGTWSSASIELGRAVNHPGPLMFDVLVPFVRLFGMRDGLPIGAAVVNVAAIGCAVRFGGRAAGRVGAAAMAAAASMLAITMGSATLVDPWNPHLAMLPLLAVLAAGWCVVGGDSSALPWMVGLGSFCMQAHLGDAAVVPLLVVLAWVVGGRRFGRRALIASALVAGVLWIQPLLETVLHGRDGNLVRLAAAGGGTRVGPVLAVRLVSAVLVQAPWGLRSGFMAAIPATAPGDVVMTRALLPALVTVVGGIALLGARASDRRLCFSLGSLVIALVGTTIAPVGPFGLSAHQFRWLWPVAAAIWAAVAVHAALALRARPSSGRLVATLGLAAASAAALPPMVQPAGPNIQAASVPAVRRLVNQLGAVEGTVLVDHSGTPLFDGAWDAVVAELVAHDVQVYFDDDGLVRQYGERRRSTGSEDVRLVMRWGEAARRDLPGYERIAVVDEPTGAIAVYLSREAGTRSRSG